jgi:hypothetical protein
MMDEIEAAITINSSTFGDHQFAWSQLVTPDPPPLPPDDLKTSIDEKVSVIMSSLNTVFSL